MIIYFFQNLSWLIITLDIQCVSSYFRFHMIGLDPSYICFHTSYIRFNALSDIFFANSKFRFIFYSSKLESVTLGTMNKNFFLIPIVFFSPKTSEKPHAQHFRNSFFFLKWSNGHACHTHIWQAKFVAIYMTKRSHCHIYMFCWFVI